MENFDFELACLGLLESFFYSFGLLGDIASEEAEEDVGVSCEGHVFWCLDTWRSWPSFVFCQHFWV